MLFVSIIFLIPFSVGMLALFYAMINSGKYKRHALLFHSISGRGNGISRYSPEKFELVMKLFYSSGIRCVSFEEYITTPEENKVVLLFDDGFRDFYDVAFPILLKYKFSATLFPIAKTTESNFKWDVFSGKKYLTGEEIRKISEAGFEIGSHTYSHPNLRFLSDGDIKTELLQSKNILTDITGKEIKTISFPFGSVNSRIWKISEGCGFERGVAYGGCTISDASSIIPSLAAYSFESAYAVFKRTTSGHINSFARALILPHFAKGTALWMFRKNYSVLNYFP